MDSSTIEILLLTNRDSDNLGDQVIEACDISLIRTVMDNLGLTEADYRIASRAAGIVSMAYLSTRDEALLETARELIEKADVIVFGGAPLFNFRYQVFYERTAVTLELAQEYGKPVIFSAIGVEEYDGKDERCQRLKTTLNFDCVRQITTRDDYESLQKFVENESVALSKVADPAVFSNIVLNPFIASKKNKIGLFVIRSNAFIDNGIKFNRKRAADFWCKLIEKLEAEDLDYELLTSGHFGDEAFLDYLIRHHSVSASKCVFGMLTPEDLIGRISSYDAILSCRLHPSIIAYSLGVPSISLVWNRKVPQFYDSIGCEDRAFSPLETDAESMVSAIKSALGNPAPKDPDFIYSNYKSLFEGLRNALMPDSTLEPYPYSELADRIPPYKGTSEKMKSQKIVAKFRRTYGKYNDIFDKNREITQRLKSSQPGKYRKLRSLKRRVKKLIS